MKKIKTLVLTALAGSVLVACGGNNENMSGSSSSTTDDTETQSVSVGVVGDVATQIWEDVATRVETESIDLEVVTFNDYVQPNRALEEGEVDLNAFQHVAFLNDYVNENSSDVVPIGYTFISPLGLYPNETINTIEEIPDGATVALPNDPTNGGRAYLLLEAAGLIKVDDEASYTPSSDDVTSNPKNLVFEEMDAAQIPRALGDADLAIVNTNYAVDAGLIPREDAIYIDTDHMDKVNDVYKNVIATKSDNVENETFNKIVAAYQQPETADLIAEFSKETDISAWSEDETPAEDFAVLQGN